MKPPAITSVVFDYGNVLSRPQDRTLVERIEALSGLSPDQLAHRYYEFRPSYDRAALDDVEYWSAVAGDRSLVNDRLVELVEADSASWLSLDARMVAWARRLRHSGVATAILSNMPHSVLGSIRRQHRDLLEEFTVTVFSCDVCAVKPEREIYERLLGALDQPPSSVLFLDDRQGNVDAAIELGIHARCFSDVDHLPQLLDDFPALPQPAPVLTA